VTYLQPELQKFTSPLVTENFVFDLEKRNWYCYKFN